MVRCNRILPSTARLRGHLRAESFPTDSAYFYRSGRNPVKLSRIEIFPISLYELYFSRGFRIHRKKTMTDGVP